MKLEIYTDASMRRIITEDGIERSFGCAGAMSSTTGESLYEIIPDTTNNKAELIAILLGCNLAKQITDNNPEFDEIHLYSDSQFSIFGLTRWMSGWVKTTDSNGIMYGSNNQPVKNQELFVLILTYMVQNNLKIHFHHMLGHVRTTSHKMLTQANEAYYKSNGRFLRPEEIYKICYYNDIVDKTSRGKLENVDPARYPCMQPSGIPVPGKVPKNYKQFVQR